MNNRPPFSAEPANVVVDVQHFIDSRGLSRLQILLLLSCFLVVAIDGFDTASIGFIAPAISTEWALTGKKLAPLFGAGLFGLSIGAFTVGPVADHHGRKAALIASIVFFGIASLVSSFAPSLQVLIALRFMTGLGLGGAMPNAITLTSEYCPAARRSFLVTLMFCGFTLGSALGGIVAAQIVAGHGWRSVLLVGGWMPLALAPVLFWSLPESVRYLVMMRREPERVRRILSRIDPHADLSATTFTGPSRAASSPVRELFTDFLLPGTLLLWMAFFMSLLVVYLLSSWLPSVIHAAGLTLKQASLITAMFQVGGTIGALVLGALMDRINPQIVLGVAYASAAPFVALIGFATHNHFLLILAVSGAGFCVSGSQTGANALAAGYYPTANRATGVSWAAGVGRIGSILGSMLGGSIFSMGWGLPAVFSFVALPTLAAGGAILALGVVRARQDRAQALAASTFSSPV